MSDRFITIAIHTYEKAIALRSLLESEGIQVEFRNVNIEHPIVSSGVRVRIREIDLALALRIIENREIFTVPTLPAGQANPSKPILVPVDFSRQSFDATVYAFTLAAKHNTSIILLHTYIDPYVAGNMQLTDSLTYEISDINTREKVESTAATQMRHFAARIKDLIKRGQLPPVQFKTEVLEGVPEDAISEYTRTNSAFVIVMGTRGPKRKEIDMIGSVTAEVLDKCRNTVLAIPEKSINPEQPFSAFSNILFFSNSDQQDILALDTLNRIYPNTGAKVTIVAFQGKKRPFARSVPESLKALSDYCQQNFTGFTFTTTMLDTDNTEASIRALENDRRFDLLVIPNKKKNIFSRLFNPTLAHRVLFASELPMLVIPV